MSAPKISLEQWRALVSVVDSGGYGHAAESLHKSQSTLTYAVQKMEHLLGVKLFEIKGRKAVLTVAGEVLYRRGRGLLDEAARLERAAGNLAAGWEAELRLAVDVIFPTWLLLKCFEKLGAEHPDLRIELHETVIGGTTEMLQAGQVDFAMADSASAISHVQGGRLRALAITTAGPSPLYRGVPTIAEAAVPGFAYPSSVGFLAPSGTPREAVLRINAALGRALANEAVRGRLNGLGFDAVPMTPEEFDAFMAGEVRKYTKVVKDLGLKLD